MPPIVALADAGPRQHRKARLLRDISLLAITRPDRLLGAGWWWLVGKRLRARYRMRDALASLPFANARWMADSGADDLADIRVTGEKSQVPLIGVHIHVVKGSDPDQLRNAIASVARQSHTAHRLLVTLEDAETRVPLVTGCVVQVLEGCHASMFDGLRAAMEEAATGGEKLLVPLMIGALLPRHALAAYAARLLREGEAAASVMLLYGDQMAKEGGDLWLKPEWDPRMVWSQDYVSDACALAVSAAVSETLSGTESIYEGLLRALRNNPDIGVHHVARITMQTPRGAWCANAHARLTAVRASALANAEVASGPFATVRMQYPRPEKLPKVSIIVATRDSAELLRTCVQGVLEETDYPDFELIIADNDSRDPEALHYMEEAVQDARVRVVRWPHPFNYSALNNFAAGSATGEYLCLLNNDIEVIEPQWLDAMVREAVQPGVGAVGARLLYPDRSIQHAGIAIGIANAAGRAHRLLPEGEAGYFAQALITRGASAVTGACLLISKRHFDAVGGLDERSLAVAYNDVDLCLKLRALGLANIYTPVATLIHHESKSRGLDFAPEHMARYMRELAAFQERWSLQSTIDPWHHPRLNRESEIYR